MELFSKILFYILLMMITTVNNAKSHNVVDYNLFSIITDAGGERVLKGNGGGIIVDVNGYEPAFTGNYIMYVNPYIVVNGSNQKYTKHFFIEGQRIASKIGDRDIQTEINTPKAGSVINVILNFEEKSQKAEEALRKATNKVLDREFSPTKGELPYGQMSNYFSISKQNTAPYENMQFFYHSDHLGSSNYITDVSGEVHQHLEYFPSGETFVHQKRSGDYTSNYLFSGKELDDETGLYYFGARYYDPRTSIFITVDPLMDKYPGISGYAYCNNNPILFIYIDGNDPRRVTITVSGISNGNTYIAKTYPQRSSRYFIVPVYNITVSGTNNEGKEVSQSWQVLRFMPFLNENPQATGYKTKTSETPIMAGLADKREHPIQRYIPEYEIHNTFSEENGGFVITGSFMIHDGPDNLQSDAGMWGAAGCMEVVGEKGFSKMKEFIFSISGSENKNIDKGLQELVDSKNLWLNLEGTSRPPVKEYEK